MSTATRVVGPCARSRCGLVGVYRQLHASQSNSSSVPTRRANATLKAGEKAKARTPHARLPGSAPRATACDMLRAQVARARDRPWPLWAGRFLNPQPPRPRPPGRIWHAARSAAARARPGGVSRGTQRKQTNQRLLSVGRSAGLATRVRGAQRSPKPNSRSYDAAASAAGIPPAALAVRECARMHARSHGRGRARKRDERRELARAWGSAPAVSSSAGHQVWALCVCAACAPPIARTRSAVDAGQAPTPSASARNFSEGGSVSDFFFRLFSHKNI